MGTQVKYTKTGITLSYDDSAVSAPRALGTYSYPSPTPLANIIAVALEDGTYDTVNFSGRKSIRITSVDDLSTAGGTGDTWAVHYSYVQADTTITGEGDLPVTSWPINILMPEALPDADYSFHLWRKSAAGVITKWAEITLAGGTPPDNTLGQITDILSDHIISHGGEKIRINQDWALIQQQYSQLLAQSLQVFHAPLSGLTYVAEAMYMVAAYTALNAAITSLTTFADTTVDTDTSSVTAPDLLGRFAAYYGAAETLTRLITYRLNPLRLYAFANQGITEPHPIDPIWGEELPHDPTNNWTAAEFLAQFGVAAVLGKTMLVTQNPIDES